MQKQLKWSALLVLKNKTTHFSKCLPSEYECMFSPWRIHGCCLIAINIMVSLLLLKVMTNLSQQNDYPYNTLELQLMIILSSYFCKTVVL